MASKILSQDRLKELLTYDPDTGVFYRNKSVYRWKAGYIAGGKNVDGYIAIQIDGYKYKAHRLAFLYVNGAFPENDVDHINGVKDDNIFINLREATTSENCKNAKISINNSSGVSGIFFNKRSSKWQVQINSEGKRYHLGVFKDWFDAVCARKSAEISYNFHPTHGRRA